MKRDYLQVKTAGEGFQLEWMREMALKALERVVKESHE